MRIVFVILGFLIIIVGVFGYLITEPTIWIWYPWIGFPNPLHWLRPLTFVFVGLGGVSALYGFISRGE